MPLPSYTYSGAVYSSPSVGTATFNLTTSGGSAIGFLDPSHIHVYTTTDGGASLVERFRPAQWDFNTARTQVTLVVPTVANEAVVIRRITPITGPLVDVPDGITLPAQRLRDLNLYNLYVTQEQYEANAAALTTAQEANTQVAIAINSIASQLAYTRYANRAAVPINPGSAIAGEILDSTNMQTFAPLAGVPSGFVGSASLIVRIRYNTGLATWQWIDYRAADADARYLLKTQLVDSVGSSSTVDPPTAKAVKTAFDKGATAQVAVDALAMTVANVQAANASQYTVVPDVASVPTGTNGLRIEITNSTNIQSFSPVTGRPSGFIGSTLLSVRLVYSSIGTTWQWVDYRPVDPDGRYASQAAVNAAQNTANAAATAATQAQATADAAILPAGMVAAFPGTVAPSGWLKLNNALISRTLYSRLWTYAQGSGNLAASEGTKQAGQFGPGDGSTTFSLPDLRAEFVRGWDDGRGVDSGRGIGTWAAGSIEAHNHSIPPLISSPGSGSTTGLAGGFFSAAQSTGSTGGTETRPRSVALLMCIKV